MILRRVASLDYLAAASAIARRARSAISGEGGDGGEDGHAVNDSEPRGSETASFARDNTARGVVSLSVLESFFPDADDVNVFAPNGASAASSSRVEKAFSFSTYCVDRERPSVITHERSSSS